MTVRYVEDDLSASIFYFLKNVSSSNVKSVGQSCANVSLSLGSGCQELFEFK